jgi:ribose transport system ATP-binding protein
LITESPAHRPLLVMEGIDKSFPGVQALRGARLDLYPGEVHALVGENGAGKSTLIKVLAGAQRPDAGAVAIDGGAVHVTSPAHARDLGVAVIYQEFNLVPTLSARENIFLGRERTRGGFVSARRERAEALALFGRIGVALDPEAPVSELTVAQQQLVEIAKALSVSARVVVMDEPTAALTPQEARRLFAVVREMTSRGVGVVYVSHRLDEIFALADRVTVMRDGRHVRTSPIGEVTRRGLIELMVGRELTNEFPPRPGAAGRIGP